MPHQIKLVEPSIDPVWIDEAAENFRANLSDPSRSLNRFEHAICDYTGAPFCALTSSGTAALHLTLILAGVSEGDTVICPSFTFAATAFAVRYCGAHPVFIVCEPATGGMDPAVFEEALRDRTGKGERPKAVVVAHNYGAPADLDQIIRTAHDYGMKVIEDAASAMGSFYHSGRHVGVAGDFGILSFNYNKIITTGGGGALLVKDRETWEKARYLTTQAKQPKPFYEHADIGYNYQMNHFSAELGLAQLSRIQRILKAKKTVYSTYQKELSGAPGITFLNPDHYGLANRWLTNIVLSDDAKTSRDDVINRLKLNQIEARPLWNPMHCQPVFRNYPFYGKGVSGSLFAKGLSLPSSVFLKVESIKSISLAVKDGF